ARLSPRRLLGEALMAAEAKATGEPGWRWRRAVIYPVVVYACWRLMALEGAADTEVNQMLAWGWMLLVAVLVLGYTGFATFQDIAAIWRTGSALPYRSVAA